MKMKARYRLFLRRKSVYYAFDDTTKTFTSLKTKDKAEANRLLMAMNEAGQQPAMNLSLARVYLRHSDPVVSKRTWQHVIDEIIAIKQGPTQVRWIIAKKDKAFDLIRDRVLIETQPEHLLAVLRAGSVSTNAFLRKIHNFAVDMNWLPATVIPRRQWLPIHYKEKRAVTLDEHLKITAAKVNPERKVVYQLCWHLGGSQGDIAQLKGEDVDWTNNTVSFFRKKTGAPVPVHLGREHLNLLRNLPAEGFLFPYLASVRPGDRATEFGQRCRQLGIKGVTLLSYRYAWAVRVRDLAVSSPQLCRWSSPCPHPVRDHDRGLSVSVHSLQSCSVRAMSGSQNCNVQSMGEFLGVLGFDVSASPGQQALKASAVVALGKDAG